MTGTSANIGIGESPNVLAATLELALLKRSINTMPTPHTKVPSHRAHTWSGLTTKTQSCTHHILVTFTSPLLAFTVTSATTAAWLLPL